MNAILVERKSPLLEIYFFEFDSTYVHEKVSYTNGSLLIQTLILRGLMSSEESPKHCIDLTVDTGFSF